MRNAASVLRVLHVEDDDVDAKMVRRVLGDTLSQGAEVVRVEDLKGAEDKLSEESFDTLLLDLSLPDATNLADDIERLRRKQDLPVVVLTGSDERDISLEAFAAGTQDVLTKNRVSLDILPLALFQGAGASGRAASPRRAIGGSPRVLQGLHD